MRGTLRICFRILNGNDAMGRPPCGELDERRWRERFERFRASGLDVPTFCRAEGVSRSTFYRWRARLKGTGNGSVPPQGTPKPESVPAAKLIPAEPVFIPVSVKAGPIEIELANGAVVRLSSEISVAFLAEVIRAVGALRPPREHESC
jgi:transposase-like protein